MHSRSFSVCLFFQGLCVFGRGITLCLKFLPSFPFTGVITLLEDKEDTSEGTEHWGLRFGVRGDGIECCSTVVGINL